jgi:multiple antibiotic resistance protein
MDIVLIRNFLLAMVAIVNPLGKIPVWIEASEGCSGPVRVRLALLVTGTAFALLLLFDFLGLDIAAFRVGGGIILLLIGIDMLRGQAVDIDTRTGASGEDALDQAKARFRDIVVPVAVPILAGPGSITTVLLFGIRAEEWSDRLVLGALLFAVMVVVLVLLLLGHSIQAMLGALVLNVQTRIWGLLLLAIAAQLILVGLGEAFPSWVDSASPITDDLRVR